MTPWERVLARTMVTDKCWLWLGGQSSKGYGQIGIDGRHVQVHRLAYENANGPIPVGLVADHTCHDPEVCAGGSGCPHRLCVNPAHLAAVTNADNLRRQSPAARTHCLRDHEYDEANTGRNPDGSRYCKACRKAAYVRRAGRSNSSAKAIRAWAVANDLPVSDRGAIPRHIYRAFHEASAA